MATRSDSRSAEAGASPVPQSSEDAGPGQLHGAIGEESSRAESRKHSQEGADITPTGSPLWLTRTLGPLNTGSVASKIFSASSITALLAGAAYECRLGYEQGIAARRGVSVDFVQLRADPAATPVQIVALLLVVSALAFFAAMLVAAFTSWPVPAAVGALNLLRIPWDLVRHTHTQSAWYDLLASAGLFVLAIAVAAI